MGHSQNTCRKIDEKTFLVLAKTNAEPTPNMVVRMRYPMAPEKLSFQTNTAIGMWTIPQTILVIPFASHSFFKTSSKRLKIYPRKAISSENAVAVESPSAVHKLVVPIFAEKSNPPYLSAFTKNPSTAKIIPSAKARYSAGKSFLSVIPREPAPSFSLWTK